MANIKVIHGPNLNLLGKREPLIYGTLGLEAINERLKGLAVEQGHGLEAVQSNAEHELIDFVQACEQDTDFIIINPAGLTHTSIVLRDALCALGKPFIEVHLSNIYGREPFRHHSFFSDRAVGVICGLGAYGYELALLAANDYINKNN